MMAIKIQESGLDKYDNISGMEFKKLFELHDEVCILANALVKESVYTVNDLSSTKDHIRQKFIDEALRLIKNLEQHNLQIIHKK